MKCCLWAPVLVAFLAVQIATNAQTSSPELQYLSSVMPDFQSGQFAQAETKLLQGLQQYPHSALLSNALGMVLEKENKTAQAITAFENATEWLPNFTAAQIHLASLLAQQGNCDRATPVLTAASATTADPGALSAIGVAFAQCKDYARAATILEKARVANPNVPAVLFNLALAQYRVGDPTSALGTLDSITNEGENRNPEVLFLRGKTLQALAKPGASAAMSEACRAHPEEDYCGDAAVELTREEQYRKAIDLLTAALPQLPPSAPLLTSLGLAQFSLGRYREASVSYSSAVAANPQLEAPREGLAFLLYITGDLAQAAKVVTQASSAGISSFYLSYLHALVCFRMGRDHWPEALTYLDDSLKRNSQFAPAYFLQGKVLMEQNDLDAALHDFQTAANLDGTYALPYYKMEQIYLRRGQLEQSQAAQRKFLALGGRREEEVLARQARNRLLAESH